MSLTYMITFQDTESFCPVTETLFSQPVRLDKCLFTESLASIYYSCFICDRKTNQTSLGYK